LAEFVKGEVVVIPFPFSDLRGVRVKPSKFILERKMLTTAGFIDLIRKGYFNERIVIS
jgi:hypothetical protein